MAKKYFDVGIIVPLKEEFRLLEQHFTAVGETTEGTLFSKEFVASSGHQVVAYLQDDMGKEAAIHATEAMLSNYDIGVVVVIGIAGGLSDDVSIGDICFTGTVIDVLENAKVSDKHRSAKVEFNTKFHPTDPRLTFAFNYVDLGSEIKPAFEHWQLERYFSAKALIPGQFIGRKNKNEEVAIPSIHDGNIVCGAVSKSAIYNSDLQSIDRKVLAIETESGGAFGRANRSGVPAITLRAICDYADDNKAKLEKQTDGNARKVAAGNAVTFLKLQFENPNFIRYLTTRKESIGGANPPQLPGLAGHSMDRVLEQAKSDIHEQLQQLSPQYQGKPRGYRLPLPRVKKSAAMANVAPSPKDGSPVNLIDVIAAHRISIISVPLNYPENSLQWIIAAELTLIGINGKQALPIVMWGGHVRPPHHTLSAHTGYDLAAIHDSDSARPVFILHEFPTQSKPRSDLLLAEIKKYPEARFVIVNRAGSGLASENHIAIASAAEQVTLEDISFSEMTMFFQRSFQMEDQEASVIAFKMQNMFRTFKLNAHPSYFAGVGSETLAALLRANRRTELLEIAVKGILSFVVATDTTDVVLSRTAREGVLRRLVFEKHVKKKKFSRTEFIQFVEQMSSQKDWGIDPIRFVANFQEKGVIYFSADDVHIALPYVESYLLAAELVENPGDACEFFSLENSDVDVSTFDIYSELGPSEALVQSIITAFDKILLDMKLPDGRSHILLTSEIEPLILKNDERLIAIEDMLSRAVEDVLHSRPNSAEKQRLLDVAGRVQVEARSAQEAALLSGAGRPTPRPGLDSGAPSKLLFMAIILLGSASERLDRDPKRQLAEKIVRLSSLMLDHFLRLFPKLEFESLKTELLSDASIREAFGLEESAVIESRHKDFVSTIIDAYEFQLIGFPLRMILELLGNSAGQSVLRQSVSSINLPDRIENLIARIWSSEIDAEKGKNELAKAIAQLPDVLFLRFSLSTYFMTRVYWDHWEIPKRLALLEAGVTAIKPFKNIDKGRIERQITGKKNTDP